MGVEIAAATWLLGAKARGVDFSDLMTLGRQYFQVMPADLQPLLNVAGIRADATEIARNSGGYSEGFYGLLGAKSIASLDAVDYEGATHIHDMNNPMDVAWRNKFSVVFDGGTLSHIFNFPQAIRNVMEMLRVGGHFMQVTEVNSFVGHGFYQFSPELLYRVFSPENGFQVEAMVLHEVIPNGRWFIAPDPEKEKRRIELKTSYPTFVLTLARKLTESAIFSRWPQQSDYVSLWKNPENKLYSPLKAADFDAGGVTALQRIRLLCPKPVRIAVRAALGYEEPKQIIGAPVSIKTLQSLSWRDVVLGKSLVQ